MILNKYNFRLFYFITSTLILIAWKPKSVEKYNPENEIIDYNGVYVSRDTLFAIDKNHKNEITVSLLKFNKNKTIQTSTEYTYTQGDFDNLTNLNITKWLHHYSSFSFDLKNKAKLTLQCYSKHKRAWNNFATSSKTIIIENFTVKGDTLLRNKKNSKFFKRKYILNRQFTNNHMEIKQGNACE
jgi:hypothetical protein